jgi:CRP-like cAMP-binding protein
LIPPHPRQNNLLASLSKPEYERLLPQLEMVPLALGEVLYEPGGWLMYAHFPATAIVSSLYVTKNGNSAEMIGNEGIVGIALFMGGETMPNQAVTQSAGHAYRMSGQLLQQEFQRGGELQSLLLRYTLTRLTQLMQTTVCIQYHTMDQQLCRWLLLALDRSPLDGQSVPRQLIANALAVPDEAMIEAAGKLRRAGLIRYDRDRITVLDRAALEARVCECYDVIRREFRRLFPVVIAE